jgi:hypothetical protein
MIRNFKTCSRSNFRTVFFAYFKEVFLLFWTTDCLCHLCSFFLICFFTWFCFVLGSNYFVLSIWIVFLTLFLYIASLQKSQKVLHIYSTTVIIIKPKINLLQQANHSRFCLSWFHSSHRDFNYMAFQTFDYRNTWWILFHK